MKNQGYTLVELLVTITVLGIVLGFSLVVLNKVTVKNKDTEYRIYSDVLLQASKIYNDEYQEDTFANREYGCAKVNYSVLSDKELINKINVNGINCGYQMGTNKDSSGVIIRKIKNKYYYETIMFCKELGARENKSEDHIIGGDGRYFYELGDDYCNTNAAVDKTAPKVKYRNKNYKTGHFYNSANQPKPQVQIIDSGVGLSATSDLNYKWSSKRNILELLSFTTRRGIGATLWKDVPLAPQIRSHGNYAEHLKVTVKNVTDLAKNSHNKGLAGNNIDADNTNPRDGVGSDTGTFYIDNTAPTVTVSNRVTWTNKPFTITMNVKDPINNGIRSGVRSVQYTLTNRYASSGNAQTINLSGAVPGNNNNGNNSAASGDNGVFKRSITINQPGDYTLNIYVIDWSGNVTRRSYPNYYQYDPIAPTCGTASTSSATAWINRDRTVTVGCADQTALSQCTQTRYSKTFGESNTGIITIADNAGNKKNCTVVTKVDKTKPSCRSRGGVAAWRTAGLTIYGDCTDNRSGCKQKVYSKVYSGTVSTTTAYAGVAYDNAGNSVNCTQNQHVHIDNTPPTCTLRYDFGADTPNEGLIVTLLCKDNYGISECDRYAAGSRVKEPDNSEWTKPANPEISQIIPGLRAGDYTKHVVDVAGNRATCSISIVASTCTKVEILSNHSSSCTGCNCASYWCPSGQWAVNAWSRCYTSSLSGGKGDVISSLSYGWSCKGNKTYTDGEKCGYHVGGYAQER